MTDLVRKGSPSKNPSKLYRFNRRTYDLSEEQVIATDKITDDILTTISILIDDRIFENKTLRAVMEEHRYEELSQVRHLILIRLRKELAKAKQI